MSDLYKQGKCFNNCEAKLIVGEEETELYVCMEYVAKFSEFFRAMFFGNLKKENQTEFQIPDETTEDIVCFFNAIDPDPNVQKIKDDSIELLIRLADKYQSDPLKERLRNYIEIHRNDHDESGADILNWFICSKKYNMPEDFVKMCLPGIACLPISTLLDNREILGSELCDKLTDAKIKVMLKAFTFQRVYTTSDRPYGIKYDCNNCKVKGGLFPYKFCYKRCCICLCFNCYSKRCNNHECYYKCPNCKSDPAYYENIEQCFCSRKNYEVILSE